METSLHRDLKRLYAGERAQTEVRVGRWRIDAVVEGELIEIQHGSLAALRRKLTELVKSHRVRVVKPIVCEKRLVKRRRAGGAVVERRRSPKRGALVDLFDELVFLVRLFPHPRLALEGVLVSVEEWRHPGHGRRRRWRRNDHVVEDQRLLEVHESCRLATAGDLRRLMPSGLAEPFDTRDLATSLSLPRHRAQRVAYCLREMGAARTVGKRGRAWLYVWTDAAREAA